MKSLVALLTFLVVGCSSTSGTAASTKGCWVPPMYQGFDVGLIEPTWEPKAEMLEQIPASDRGEPLCWYGYTDGRIEIRVNQTELGFFSHTFARRSGSWVLIDSHQEIIVH